METGMRDTLRQLEEAATNDPNASDPQDDARRMIEKPDELFAILKRTEDRILRPAFAEAQRKLKGYQRVGIPNRVSPDLVSTVLVPALRKYAEEVTRMAEFVAKKFA